MPSEFFPADPASLATQTDAELFHALKQGQTAALAVFYDRYADIVYGLALKLLTNPEEAEDVTQDVFLTLHQKKLYEPTRGALITFLTTMAHSRAIERLRSRSTKFNVLNRWHRETGSQASDVNPLQRAMSEEQAEMVRQALAQLSDNEQEVLKIAYYEGLTQAEIANRLNLPLGTVKTRSRQGLRKLRRALHNLID
ncbi:RNA polymerase subunit sigma [Leptolyngbya sp. 'hensonii']|uniref:sigma-70 family RNA polymerase sigma factor n=1 Tax=Leptolyngbya sp. 'hensonii' TaxID=1922337 RepID=UPI00094F8033|nr:sigma-70 family RNA polymerase sigma factor [Leptolyngbya sp. 'hensonii']OLP19518.1 RNA polymerase subunit sigma [Leptolyngbya sp. 'hensonii']